MTRYILKDGYQLIFNEQSVFYVCQYDYSFFFIWPLRVKGFQQLDINFSSDPILVFNAINSYVWIILIKMIHLRNTIFIRFL